MSHVSVTPNSPPEANWGPKRRHGRAGETKEVEPITEDGAVAAQDADAAADQKQAGETAEPAAKRAKN